MADIFTLEINDCGLSVSKNADVLLTSPGYALIDGSSFEVGERAYQQARLHPRRAHNQFWHRLSLDPLVYPTQRFRHQADLAHAHLAHIAESVEGLNDVVVAVPSYYSREQLSLLLGIASESPLNIIGLVDASVAALALQPLSGQSCYLDLHLHHAVLVSLGVSEKIKRTQIEVLDRSGLASLYDKWVQLIANAFIDQCRFDPLHSAETEQALYNQLPEWLAAIGQREEVILELESSGKRFDCRLKRAAALAAIAPNYQRIAQAAQKIPGNLYVSERVAALPGIADHLSGLQTVAANSVASSCAQFSKEVASSGESLSFITALPASAVAQPAAASSPTMNELTDADDGRGIAPAVSHLLSESVIYPLRQDLYVGLNAQQIPSVASNDSELAVAIAKIENRDGQHWLVPLHTNRIELNGARLDKDQSLRVGDNVRLVDNESVFTLVREFTDGHS